MASNSDKALALVTKSAHVHFSPKKPSLLLKKLEAIQQFESQAVYLALQVGALLWQTKAALKHGEFKPWIEENIKGRSYRSCAYYMKLTLAFAEKAKPSQEAFHAMPGLKLEKKGAKFSGAAKEIAEAMRAFVGDLSLTELLIKHGIKDVGLKSELTSGDDGAENLTAEQSAQLQLELIWSQSYEPAKALADLLAEKASTLTPEQRATLEVELKKALQALRSA